MPAGRDRSYIGSVSLEVRLGIDVGTLTTVAALAGPDGAVRPQLVESGPPADAKAVAAVLARVAPPIEGGAGRIPTVLTHPAAWRPDRRRLLADAALLAGLGEPELVSEPVAAARYFTTVLGGHVPAGRCLVVYDLGAA